MKKGILYITLSFAAILSLTTCKNDLDVLAPGKETVSVYGVLNPNAGVQNIRINKVYLTDGDAITAGQDNSTINYGSGELKVTLQRFMAGSSTATLTTIGNATKKEIVLTETVVTTAGGSFNQGQRIWQTTDKLYSNGEYKLTITNNNTGAVFSSQNVVVDSVKSYGVLPFVYHPTIYPMHGYYNFLAYPAQANNLIKYVVLTANPKIKFKSVVNAKLYNIVMRFHYIDNTPSGSIAQYIDYNFTTQKSLTLVGGEEMEVSFLVNDFYSNLGTEISKKSSANVINRTSSYMEYIITAASESLDIFLQVNQPSNTIAQDKPSYTNITGGVGLFSSTSRSVITHDLDNEFIDAIACNPNTAQYLFLKSTGVICP